MALNDLLACFQNLDAYSRPEQKRLLGKLIFELYLRKGNAPSMLVALHAMIDLAPPGIKFNPYHDELGRFTFSPGGPADDKPDNNDNTAVPASVPNQPHSISVVQEIPPIADPDFVPETETIPDAEEPLPGMQGRPLPKNPFDLLDQGYEDISDPEAARNGHYTFKNPQTGDVLRFDEGEPGEDGFGGQDHYHRPNPDGTNKMNEYLDENGNPVPRGSNPSHLLPKEVT